MVGRMVCKVMEGREGKWAWVWVESGREGLDLRCGWCGREECAWWEGLIRRYNFLDI